PTTPTLFPYTTLFRSCSATSPHGDSIAGPSCHCRNPRYPKSPIGHGDRGSESHEQARRWNGGVPEQTRAAFDEHFPFDGNRSAAPGKAGANAKTAPVGSLLCVSNTQREQTVF